MVCGLYRHIAADILIPVLLSPAAASTLGLGSTAQFQVLSIPTTGLTTAPVAAAPAAEPQVAGGSATAAATGKNSTVGATAAGR